MKKIISILSGLFLFASLNVSAGDFLLNEYQVVTIKDFESGTGTHIAGKVFVGGDYKGGLSDVGYALKESSGIDTLTVAGKMNAKVTTYHNNIVLNKDVNSNSLSSVGEIKLTTGLEAIKADYKSQLENSSEYFASLDTKNNTIGIGGDSVNKKTSFTVDDSLTANDIAVFSLDGTKNIFDSKNNDLSFLGSNLDDIASIIINVSGEVLSMGLTSFGNFISPELSSKVIWNFYEATKIDLGDRAFYGALLAPYATVTQTGGNIYGSVGAFSLITKAEINVPTDVDVNIPTDVVTPPGSATEVPEPSTLMLMFIAMAGLIYKRKTLNV